MEQTVRGNQPETNRPAQNKIPAELSRRYDVLIKPQSTDLVVPIRNVKAEYIGKLINLKVRSLPMHAIHGLIFDAFTGV